MTSKGGIPSPRAVVLGSGERVPYPEPTSAHATKVGKAVRRVDTKPEQALRSALHRRGLRFRKDLLVRADAVRVHVDVAFPRRRIAVFVDGCFWHACPVHGNVPKANTSYWQPKLAANVARDRRVDAALAEHGWMVVRVWEHDNVDEVADTITALVHDATGATR